MSSRAVLVAAVLAAPTAAFAAGGGSGHAEADVGGLLRHGMNLLALLVLLYLALRGPLGDFLKFRRSEVKGQLDRALAAKSEAEARYAELSRRLEHFESELAAMRAQAAEDAKVEKQSLLASARRAADSLRETAERNIAEEVRRARESLRADAASLSVQIAEDAVRRAIDPSDQARLAADYVKQVGETARS